MHYDYVYLASSCEHLRIQAPRLLSHIQHFSQGEMAVSFETPLQGKSILFLTSMAGQTQKPHDLLVETLLTLRALRPAKHITLGLLYGAYTRQNDGGDWMYSLLGEADHIWVLDSHVPPPNFIEERTAAPLWVNHICEWNQGKPPLVVSPDHGGHTRAQRVAQALGADLCVLSKKRLEGHITIQNCEGSSPNKRTCIVIDDVVDSGCTLTAGYHFLKHKGAQDIHACVTHALTTASTLNTLSSLYTTVGITNSVAPSLLPSNVWVAHLEDWSYEA